MPSPEHEALVAYLTRDGRPLSSSTRPSLEQIQATRADEKTLEISAPDGFIVENVDLNGVPALRVQSNAAPPSRTMLYFHGGGYIWMTPPFFLGVLASLAQHCDAECIAIDYRRAPEYSFPAPVEDALTAYRAIADHADKNRQIVVAGDSAGGGLAIVTLLGVRRQKLPLPAAGIVFSPWTDLTTSGESAMTADDPIVDDKALRMMAEVYLEGQDAEDPRASPLYTDDAALAKLPPLLIQVGTREALLDDARRFAAKAKRAGAPVRLVEYEGVIHMWIVVGPQLPESVAAFRAAGDFLREVATSKDERKTP